MLAPAMSSDYVRTRVARLKVSGYRSLYDVELDDLPEIVVFHGKNGTGKSNLMRVPALVLGWAAVGAELPTAANRIRMDYAQANTTFGLRETDFSHGRAPDIRIELSVELGTAAGQLLNRSALPLGRLELSVRVQDVGGAFELWFEHASLGNAPLVDPWRENDESRHALLGRLQHELQRQSLILRLGAYRSIESEPLVQTNDRPPLDGANWFQRRIYSVHVDPDLGRRRQLKRLGHRLSQLGLFPGGTDVELAPAQDPRFHECRLYVAVPGVGDVPLQNLGTGQQQLIMMAADVLLQRRPIVQLEEPEAHLYTDLMEAFARFLRLEAEDASEHSPIDQLWIATHHHAFAIAPEYFEVEHDPIHGTTVQRRDRAYAAKHFYEPGPLWEALRSYAESTSRETVVMHDGHGHPVTAGEILDSMNGDRQRANEFVAAATRTIVRGFRKQPVEGS
jgi:ABC-type transport system involved in cytochrome c biogenesis ATPase subunit